MELPGARFSTSSKNIKTHPKNISYIFRNKKFIFWDIELSSPKIKKNSYIFSRKVFLIFWEIELSCPKIKKLLIFLSEIFFLIIREMELFKKTCYILGGIFLSSEKIYNILGNWTFWPQA